MDRLEIFILSAVGTLIAVRLFLEVTGYPQVGNSTLHVAHVLWGGLLMAVGMIILFSFLGKVFEALGTLIGGIGFGLFIDEVGKFVTKDNDYFFKPAVAIMYTVFILLYLGARLIMTSTRFSSNEYLVNSINEMREIPIGLHTDDEKKLILYGLKHSDSTNQFVTSLKGLVGEMETEGQGNPGFYLRVRSAIFRWYRNVTSRRWFSPLVIAFFILQFIGLVIFVLITIFEPEDTADQLSNLTFSDWAILISDIFSGIFIAWGILLLRQSRLRAYRMFERSVLVQILIGQMFLFYQDEFSAAPGFIFYLLLLLAIRFMTQREQNEVIERTVAATETEAV